MRDTILSTSMEPIFYLTDAKTELTASRTIRLSYLHWKRKKRSVSIHKIFGDSTTRCNRPQHSTLQYLSPVSSLIDVAWQEEPVSVIFKDWFVFFVHMICCCKHLRHNPKKAMLKDSLWCSFFLQPTNVNVTGSSAILSAVLLPAQMFHWSLQKARMKLFITYWIAWFKYITQNKYIFKIVQ